MDAAQDIKTRLDVVDIVGEYLQLKPAGSGSFKANCPFHHEKTPSFFVNRPRQTWHCFGCDIGGDLISFVQKMEGLEFPEALELLAQKAGVTLPQFNPEQTSLKKRLFEVNDAAARFFRSQLVSSSTAEHARAYVAKRGLDDLTSDVWRIGYAPDGWTALTDALRKKGMTDDELLRAGLVLKSDRGGVYDRFRDRLMFTICDVHGHVVGFTGRVLNADAKEAKYVNTPETAVYKKSAVVFGLDKAKGEIKRQNLAVLVEGNMDVITSHQFNVSNVVATSGTALTSEQLHLLKRFTPNLAIAFDADGAGKAATIRGLDLARELNLHVKIISLPADAGKDPDEAIRKNVTFWTDAIKNAQPIVDWLYRQAFQRFDHTTPDGKRAISEELLPEFVRIPSPVERDAWITRLASDLAVSEDSLREAARSTKSRGFDAKGAGAEGRAPSAPTKTAPEGGAAKPRIQELEERILAILQLRPELAPLAESVHFAYYIRDSLSSELLNYLAILADREFQDQSLDALKKELEQTRLLLRDSQITKKRAQLEQDMRDAERIGDMAKIQELLAQFTNLN